MVSAHPSLLHEPARVNDGNWGPPMSYAANLGRDRIIELLHALGARDLEQATDRAVLQGKIGTAKLLHRLAGSPKPSSSMFGGAAYTLSDTGTAFLLEIGAELKDASGHPDGPVDVVLQSDSRKPAAKHAILEMYASHGIALPDTPMMALHRGRIDLLEQHLARDAGLLTRTFSYAEIFPPALRCDQPRHDGVEDLPRTPIGGATLLHACVEFDELDIARWLLERGMNPDVCAVIDAKGFGGHTALFNSVVSYPHFWMNRFGGDPARGAAFTRLLLDAGADPGARASLREHHAGVFYEYRDITAVEWGERFHDRTVVSAPAIAMLSR